MAAGWPERLRAAGQRVTAQRLLVLDIVDTLRHATPDDILAESQRRGHPLDVSTIYRTLEVLDDVGLITHAHLGHGSPTYHPIDERPHIHLVCRICDRVQSVDAVEFDPAIRRVHDLTGFRADPAHLVLHGVCADCAAPGRLGKP